MSKKVIGVIIGILVVGIILLMSICSKKGDKAVSQEELEKALLHICITNEQGVENYASGFVLDMDDESIYICTNAHVLCIAETGTAYFFDGTSAAFTCLGYDEVHDVGIATISRSDIADTDLEEISLIPISKARWETFLQQGGALGMTIMGKNGAVETKQGKAVAFVQNKYFEDTVLQVTIPIVPGNSGSAIVDEMGYLMGIAVGEVREVGFDIEYYAAPLEDIAYVYEALLGHKLY